MPEAGTNPLTAFMSVDFPAPLVPMSPTSSPRCTSNSTSRTALFPPKLTLSACVRSHTGESGTAGLGGTVSAEAGIGAGLPGEARAPKRERLIMCSRASRPL